MATTAGAGPGVPRNLPPSLLWQRMRSILIILAVCAPAIGLGFVLCPESKPSPTTPAGDVGTPVPSPGGKPAPGPPIGPFTVSYTAAAGRLADVPEAERREQLRDWLRTALAARLNLDIRRYQDAVYDTTPARDEGLADIAVQPNGPGRALFDGRDLHLLVPSDDRYESRTIGLLLDQHRADHGSDPRNVQIHRYTIDTRTRTIQVRPERPRTPDGLRDEHGYVTMRVDRRDGLRTFLERTRHLSWLERRGKEIWAGGWKWPTGSAPKISLTDVGVLQRGYRDDTDGTPGFSLDPPKNRGGRPVSATAGHYHQARYIGGLEGTEVGMTLFYTDLIAKQWVNGIGSGVPDKAVRGFVPDPDAKVPAAHCPVDGKIAEQGRLWFGQNESGFRFGDRRVDIGARATRLFMRTSAGDGEEVDSSYIFGRGLRWWDRHYQDVADYEPQYARLEQLMRWSAALEWLSSQPDAPGLPAEAAGGTGPRLRFQDWYARHDELRERRTFRFVTPSSGRPETLVTGWSKPYRQCGLTAVRGGVTLADVYHRMDDGSWQPRAVPDGSRRAGLFDPASQVDPTTGTGRISQVRLDEDGTVAERLERRISRGDDGSSTVESIGEERKDGSFGELDVWREEGTPRKLQVKRTAGKGGITETIAPEGHTWGRLEADAGGGRVVLRWIRGPLERVRLALQSAQDGSEPARDSVLYEYQGHYKVGGPGDPWLKITKDLAAPDGELKFRLGTPGPGGAPEFSVGELHPASPGRPWNPRGPPDGWLKFPGEPSKGPMRVAAGPPPDHARKLNVETPDHGKGEIWTDGKHAWARAGDPVTGLGSGPAVAAMLRDFESVAEAWREAERARDGHDRGVPLGGGSADGAALVGADRVLVAPPGHRFAERVREALGSDQARSRPLIGIEAGQPVHHGRGQIIRTGRPERMELGELTSRDNVFASERMMQAVASDRDHYAAWLPRRAMVRVTVVPGVAKVDPKTENPNVLADSYREAGRTSSPVWRRVTGPGASVPPVVSGPSPTPTTSSPTPIPTIRLSPPGRPSTPSTPSAPGEPDDGTVQVRVWLVCLDEGAPDPACTP